MVDSQQELQLLKMLWRRGGIDSLPTLDGGEVKVCLCGEYCEERDRFIGAEVIVDGVVHRGEVVIELMANGNGVDYENSILQVVPRQSSFILNLSGEPLPQALFELEEGLVEFYTMLCDGANNFGCGDYLAQLESHQRVALFTRLLVERLKRKQRDVEQIFDECYHNWNQTLYTMLLRTMGDSQNKEAFTELARRVSYINIARERSSILNVEAMLLGVSGLLEIYDEDIYTRELKETFLYLQRKYELKPMVAGQWKLYRIRAANHPVLRIAQLSTFLAKEEFMFDRMMRIDSNAKLLEFFSAEASHYWSTHSTPGGRKSPEAMPKRIGSFKAELLGINLVVPMMFAFSDYTHDESLKERAIDLLEDIGCERNFITKGWSAGGVRMESAFDSQATIQLHNEYCKKRLCWSCPVGRRAVDRVLKVVEESQKFMPL